MNNYIIGIDAGGTKVAYGLFDSNAELIYRYEEATDIMTNGERFCKSIINNIDMILSKNYIDTEDLLGIGICMPSYIIFDEGYISITSAMPEIKDFAMKDYLRNRIDTKIVIDNDSNGAALAEYLHGAGKGLDNMVYISAGTGIGSGLIINGKLFRGSYGCAGECGHMIATIDEGIECGCGNKGCYMSWASGRYIPAHIENNIRSGRYSSMSGMEVISCKELLMAYKNGDILAIDMLEQMALYYGICIYNVYQLLNIDTFVFGGGLVNFGEELFGKIRSIFDRYNKLDRPVYFKYASLGEDFGIIGAMELVKQA